MRKLFEVHQKITLLGNEYRVFKEGKLTAYVRQKRFALREQFTLFNDEDQTTILATSKARKILDLSTAFDILDSEGKHLATAKKQFKKSLISSTWKMYSDPELKELTFTVSESNQLNAVARRIWEFIPFIDFMPYPFIFHFSVYQDSQQVGLYRKVTYFRDHYAFYLNERYVNTLDERAWMIFAVLLDAMQSR
ncbi:hypothetical protein HYW36_02885 [Candidatus Saccharibacteria bacterium]|nr:hypothetical protein [Candidatus Saccharibacteria bacterium]